MKQLIQLIEQSGGRAVSARELHDFLGSKKQPLDPNVEQWQDYVLSDSQLDIIGQALLAWTESKKGNFTENETIQMNCLLEELYGRA